jgi:hypothetical protein
MWMMMTRKLKIAAAQYPLDELKDLPAYEAKITRWIEVAVGAGAGLLVFPEYGSMELASIGARLPMCRPRLTWCQGWCRSLTGFMARLLQSMG